MLGGKASTTTRSAEPMTLPRSGKKASTTEPNMVERVARQLKSAIVAGRYRSGDRLIERTLAREFQVSRQPVREALRDLEREGLVELQRNRGARVTKLDLSYISDVYSIRLALGHIALERLLGDGRPVPPAYLTSMKQQWDKAARCAAKGKAVEAVEADLDFQQLMIEASGHKKIPQYFLELSSEIRRFHRMVGRHRADQVEHVEKYVGRIYLALRAGDLAEASTLWRDKLRLAVEWFSNTPE